MFSSFCTLQLGLLYLPFVFWRCRYLGFVSDSYFELHADGDSTGAFYEWNVGSVLMFKLLKSDVGIPVVSENILTSLYLRFDI